MDFKEFDIIGTYEKAFGEPPAESLLEIFSKAKACGVRERIIMVAIYTAQNAHEKGDLKNTTPEKEVARRLRRMYRNGIR